MHAQRLFAVWLCGLAVQASAPAWSAEAAAAVAPAVVPASAPALSPTVAADAPADVTANPASDAAAAALEQVSWRLDIRAPAELKALLGNYLDLARFQTLVGKAAGATGTEPDAAEDDDAGASAEAARARTSAPTEATTTPAPTSATAPPASTVPAQAAVITRAELRRLVAATPDQVRSLLQARGHFQPEVRIEVNETPGSSVVDVRIQVQPGPLTRISKVQLLFEGELDARLSDDEPAARALVDDITEAWELPEGEVFTQSDWTAAKNAAMATLRARGYPVASWSGTSVTVDPEARKARLFLVADSGPAYRFGPVLIEGLQRLPASTILNVAPFRAGDPYNERQVIDWQERISKLALFENLYVNVDLDPATAKAAPVIVQVKERPLQNATVGVGTSSDTGPRVSFEHVHRNVFSTEWQLKTKAQIGLKASSGGLDFTSLPWPGRRKGLVSLQGAYLIDSDNNVTTSQYVKVGQLREGSRLERTDYVSLQRAEVRSSSDEVVSLATAYAWTTQFIFRDVDNQVSPTEGTTTLAEATGGRSYSALLAPGYFGRAYLRLTGYQPFGNGWHATARGEVGQIFAADDTSIPDTLLFRAGGDESVRGYAYRSLGVIEDGVVVGGRAMVTTSFELAHPIWPTLPTLWGAVFVDAGDAASRFGNLSPRVGYGTGIRYRSPVGPLRLDIAHGVREKGWRLHFSVGISL